MQHVGKWHLYKLAWACTSAPLAHIVHCWHLVALTCVISLGTLPCQGSFVLTPRTAAIPRELSLDPQIAARAAQVSREISLNPHGLGTAAVPATEVGSDAGSLQYELSQSPPVFEFAQGWMAAHQKTAKLSQPIAAPQPAKLPGADFGIPRAGRQGRAVQCSLESDPVRNPRTSIEDLSQMQSCLSQLERQLVQMPRPVSRGQGSRPQTAEAVSPDHRELHTDRPRLQMHMQQPGFAALGKPSIHHAGSDTVSFLPPAGQHASQQDGNSCKEEAQQGNQAWRVQQAQQLQQAQQAPLGQGEDEGRGSRPSSAGSVAQQPQFAVLKARVHARRQGQV